MEQIDVGKTYAEIEEAISLEDHEKVLALADKILKADAKEKEALQCKLIALINLSKNEEIISLLEKNGLQAEYLMEYAYALHEKKRYADSISVLNQNTSKEISVQINELIAQNYYKMGNFKESYEVYKGILEQKLKTTPNEIEEEKDLISNLLAAYSLSDSSDEGTIKSIMKYLNTWESFYNYCVICLKQGKLNEAMETLNRMRKDYPQQGDEFNELKNLNLNLNLVQPVMEGFDFSKYTNLFPEYEKVLLNQNELSPYFYNNFLHVKKDRESLSEVLKKLDSFIKGETLFNGEKNTLIINKIILLIRTNRINEAQELFKSLPVNFEDYNYVIIYCYMIFKQEKNEKFEEMLKSDGNIKNKPEAHLLLIQMMLSTLTSKNIEQFHLKVLNFVKQFFHFTLNFNFLNFFLGFYESRHLKDYLKEFIRNYKDPLVIFNSMKENKPLAKQSLILLAKSFYTVGLHEESSQFFSFVIDNLDRYDSKAKLDLINALSHFNVNKSEELRRQMDETVVDLSNEHVSGLLSEVFFKNRRNQGEKKKSNKKTKKRYPKNFDPKKPGILPDPERWIPKMQRKKYRNVAKNKLAYQGAVADNSTTSTIKK